MAKKRNGKRRNNAQTEPEKTKRRIKTLAAIVLAGAVAVLGGVAVYEYVKPREKNSSYASSIDSSDPVYFKSLPAEFQKKYRGYFPLGAEEKSQGRAGAAFEAVSESLRKFVQENKEMLLEKGLSKHLKPDCKEITERTLVALLDESPDNYIKQAEKSIKAMLEFVKSPCLNKKDYEIIVPESAADIELTAKDENKINIYLLKNRVNILRYKFILGKTKKGEDYYKEIFLADLPVGTAWRDVTFLGDFKGIEKNPPQNILISTDLEKTAGDFSTTPYIELLHTMIGRHTIEHAIKKYEGPYKEGRLTMEQCIDITESELCKEEVLVHSIAYLFTEKYASENNLFDFEKEKSNIFHEFDKGKYKGMNKMIPRIREIGVQKAIEIYISNPEELFKGIIE